MEQKTRPFPYEMPLGYDDVGMLNWIDIDQVIHIMLLGASGYGKTWTTKQITAWLIKNNFGFLWMDPRGEPARKIVELYAALKGKDAKGSDFIYISPKDSQKYGRTVVVNPLDLDYADANTLVGQMHQMNKDSWGPKLASVLRNAIQCILALADKDIIPDEEKRKEYSKYVNVSSLTDFIMDEDYRENFILPMLPDDLRCKRFFYTMYKQEYGSDKGASTYNKLDALLSDPRIQPTIDYRPNDENDNPIIDWSDIIMNNKQVIADLSGMALESTQFLGSVMLLTVLGKLRMLSKQRSERKDVKPFFIIIDEASYFAVVIPAMMRELFNSRAFGARMIANTQSLEEKKIPFASEVPELISTIISFKGGSETSRIIGPMLKRDGAFMSNLERFTFAYYNQPNARGILHTQPRKESPYYASWEKADPLMRLEKNPIPDEITENLIVESINFYGQKVVSERDRQKEIAAAKTSRALAKPRELTEEEKQRLKLKEAGLYLTVPQWLALLTTFKTPTQSIKLTELYMRLAEYGFDKPASHQAIQSLDVLKKLDINGEGEKKIVHVGSDALKEFFFQFPVNESPRGGGIIHTSIIAKWIRKEIANNRFVKVDISNEGRAMADMLSIPIKQISPGQYDWDPANSRAIEIEAHAGSHWNQVAENILKNQHHKELFIECTRKPDYDNFMEKVKKEGIDPTVHKFELVPFTDYEGAPAEESRPIDIPQISPVSPESPGPEIDSRKFTLDTVSLLLKRDKCLPGQHKENCARLSADILAFLESQGYSVRRYKIDNSIARARSHKTGGDLGRRKELEKKYVLV